MIEEFDHRVVGNEEINMAVAVVIGESDTQAFAAFCETDFLRDFREMAVAVVVVDERRNGLKDVRMTIGTVAFFVFAAPDVVEIPLKVAEDNKIEQAVIV